MRGDKVVRAPLPERSHPSSMPRDRIDLVPWNEVTMRVIICMSRARARCNEELWYIVAGETCTRARRRISGDYDRVENRERDVSDRSARIRRLSFVDRYCFFDSCQEQSEETRREYNAVSVIYEFHNAL